MDWGAVDWLMAVLPLLPRMETVTEVMGAEQEITPRTGKEDRPAVSTVFLSG